MFANKPFKEVGAAIVGSAVVGGVSSDRASSRAASASEDASRRSVEEQRRQFDLMRKDTEKYREVGKKALNKLGRMATMPSLEMDPSMSGLEGDFTFDPSQVEMDPGYQFRQEEGFKGLQNMLSAQGRAMGGSALKEAIRYNQGFASNEYGQAYERALGRNQMDYSRAMNNLSLRIDEYNRAYGRKRDSTSDLFQMAGLGQSANSLSGQMGASAASGISNSLAANAATQANAAAMRYSGINNAIQGGMQNYLMYNYLNG